jgi:hypothetical protein
VRTAPDGRDSMLRAELRSLRSAFTVRAKAVETMFQQPSSSEGTEEQNG